VTPKPKHRHQAIIAIWDRFLPELVGITSCIPNMPGNLCLTHRNAGFGGGSLLVVTLVDTMDTPSRWWWHETIYLADPRADLRARLAALTTEVLRHHQQNESRPAPKVEWRRRRHPHIIPMDDYRELWNRWPTPTN
jgi:hypothetical protein